MPALSLKALTFRTPDGRTLFDTLDLSFAPGRTGLIGRNGTGKSTLLRLIAGEVLPAAGDVLVTGRIGMLRQTVQAESGSVAEALDVADALARLARLETGAGTLDDAELADWTLPQRIETALGEVGLSMLDPARPVETLSGGQRTRLGLARLLLLDPDILLMDEPTNNLDAEGRAAVAHLLKRWRGMAVIVSHDRSLLREMDQIVELTSLGATLYGGNWDLYEAQKALQLAAAERGLQQASGALEALEQRAQAAREKQAKRNAAGARGAAKGGTPRILLGARKDNAERTGGEQSKLADRRHAAADEQVEAARAKVEILTPLSIRLNPTHLAAGSTVLQFDRVTGGPVPGNPVLRAVSFALTGPDRVAVTGPNGSGKTTLLRLAVGALTPSEGSVRITPRHALLDQTVRLLDPALTIRDNYLALNPGETENDCRAALARLQFRGDAALRMVGTLSGGEVLRAGLACTIGSPRPPDLLILDEPTNHLDIHAVAELEAGLTAYDGALLVVSHDADFLAAIGITRTIALSSSGEVDTA